MKSAYVSVPACYLFMQTFGPHMRACILLLQDSCQSISTLVSMGSSEHGMGIALCKSYAKASVHELVREALAERSEAWHSYCKGMNLALADRRL